MRTLPRRDGRMVKQLKRQAECASLNYLSTLDDVAITTERWRKRLTGSEFEPLLLDLDRIVKGHKHPAHTA